jgi:putative tryptophan/tyrosine transport system substrate-binding protein
MKGNQYIKYLFFLIVILLIGLLLTACGGTASKTYTIGILNLSANQETTIKGFKDGMAELGYVEGKNVTYVYDGPTTADKLDEVAQNLVKAKVDLILSLTTNPTKAAQKATAGTDIPVVFIPVTNPVESGIVKSLTQPGGNITGVTGVAEGKRLEWLLQVVPTIKQVYIVYNPKDPSPVQALKLVNETAAKIGVKLITREATNADEVKAAFNDIPQEADAMFLLPDSVVNTNIKDTFKIAIEHKLPTSGPSLPAINDGALTVYGLDLAASAKKQVARMANQILQGAKPADLPVETAEFSSALNLKTAQAIGLTISDDVLRQANTVVR